MRRRTAAALLLLLGWTATAEAQHPTTAEDSLKSALATAVSRLDSLERGRCPSISPIAIPAASGKARTDSLITAVRALSDRLDRLRATQCGPAAEAAAPPADTGDALAAIRAAAAAAGGGAGSPADTAPKGPTKFEGRQRNGSALNPEISATGDIRVVLRDNGTQRDNFVPQEFEVGVQSALDPYSFAKIFLTFSPDEIGVEEGYLYWTGLPGRLRLDFGKFRQQIGDLNRWHLHALPETNYPLVYQRFLDEEGLSGTGLSLYTALPLSLAKGTHEVWLQATTTGSDPFLAGSSQPVFLGRLQNFWQLTRSTYMQLGFTGLGGQNSDSALSSRVLGLDFRLTWRPPAAGTRRDLTLRAEGYQFHSTEAGLGTDRYGAFVDATFKAGRRWILGARYDWVEAPRGPADTEWRLTPTLTWWQSEFVYLRLEGEHRQRDIEGSANQLTLQAVFAMGPHKHETY